MHKTELIKDPGQQVDIGRYGYLQPMFVYMNQAPDAEKLVASGVTRAYAEAILSQGLYQIGFSSQPGGIGAWHLVQMTAEDAANYPVGTEVVFHCRKTKEIGFGDVVAIGPAPEEPAPAPGK